MILWVDAYLSPVNSATRLLSKISMPILNFTEIPEAHLAGGLQDTFELFGRDFLAYLGYEIVQEPNRGADGGRDLIVQETRKGVGGETVIKWLVSCKHKAHSGNSVTPGDEADISDRVRASGCQGFLGFYSTLPSAGLAARLQGLKADFEVQHFDRERIESEILGSSDGIRLAERYFPVSLDTWKTENPQPVQLWADQGSLHCDYCDKDLLQPPSGIITIWQTTPDNENENRRIIDIYWSCKGHCDRALTSVYLEKYAHISAVDGWEDIPDICIPLVYIRWAITTITRLHRGVEYTDTAINRLKTFLLEVYPYVARQLTTKEKETIDQLTEIPHFLGGLDFGD